MEGWGERHSWSMWDGLVLRDMAGISHLLI
jgi:hypothetical protein